MDNLISLSITTIERPSRTYVALNCDLCVIKRFTRMGLTDSTILNNLYQGLQTLYKYTKDIINKTHLKGPHILLKRDIWSFSRIWLPMSHAY